MNCPKCGFPLNNNEEKCPNCGKNNLNYIKNNEQNNTIQFETQNPLIAKPEEIEFLEELDDFSSENEAQNKTETNQIEMPENNIGLLDQTNNEQYNFENDIKNIQENDDLNKEKNEQKNPIVMIVLGVVAVLIIGVLIYAVFFTKKNKDNPINEQNPIKENEQNTNTENKKETIKIVDEYYYLPDGYSIITEMDNTSYGIQNENNKIDFLLVGNNYEQQLSYENYKQNSELFKQQIKNKYSKVDAELSDIIIKTFNNIEIMYCVVKTASSVAIEFVTNTKYDAYIYGSISNKNNQINETVLEDFTSIFVQSVPTPTN